MNVDYFLSLRVFRSSVILNLNPSLPGHKNEHLLFGFKLFCEKDADKYAEKNGLYVLAPFHRILRTGDIMVLLNSKGFTPKIFKFT